MRWRTISAIGQTTRNGIYFILLSFKIFTNVRNLKLSLKAASLRIGRITSRVVELLPRLYFLSRQSNFLPSIWAKNRPSQTRIPT